MLVSVSPWRSDDGTLPIYLCVLIVVNISTVVVIFVSRSVNCRTWNDSYWDKVLLAMNTIQTCSEFAEILRFNR